MISRPFLTIHHLKQQQAKKADIKIRVEKQLILNHTTVAHTNETLAHEDQFTNLRVKPEQRTCVSNVNFCVRNHFNTKHGLA